MENEPYKKKEPFGKSYCNEEFPVFSFLFALYCDPEFGKNDHELWEESLPSYTEGGGYRRPTLEELRRPGVYQGYFDFYTLNDKRQFPQGARRMIAEDIPLLGYVIQKSPDEGNKFKGYYVPTTALAADMVHKYLLPELTGAEVPNEPALRPKKFSKYQLSPNVDGIAIRNPREQPERTAASTLKPVRPLLACLGTIFLDDNLHPHSPFRENTDAFLDDFKGLSSRARNALSEFGKSTRVHLTVQQAHDLVPSLIDELTAPEAVW